MRVCCRARTHTRTHNAHHPLYLWLTGIAKHHSLPRSRCGSVCVSSLCLGVFFGQVVVENLPRGTSWQDLKDFMRKAGDVGFSEVNRDGTRSHTRLPPSS